MYRARRCNGRARSRRCKSITAAEAWVELTARKLRSGQVVRAVVNHAYSIGLVTPELRDDARVCHSLPPWMLIHGKNRIQLSVMSSCGDGGTIFGLGGLAVVLAP